MNRVLIYKMLPLLVGFAFTLIKGLQGNVLTWWDCLSPVAAGSVVWLFAQLLRLLSPGTLVRSKLLYCLLALSMAPVFVASGTGTHLVMTALLLLLCLVYNMVFVVEHKGRKQLAHAVLVAACSILLLFWVRNDLNWSQWSFTNLFRRSFVDGRYWLPNLVYILTPWCHIYFFVLLPVLFAVLRKTDFYLTTKKILVAGLGIYGLLIGGLPVQNPAWLLPAYVIVLLLMFPAWDRFIAYGFYFLKIHWMYLSLGIAAVVQIVGTALLLFDII